MGGERQLGPVNYRPKDELEDMAERILSENGLLRAPVPIIELAKLESVPVHVAHFSSPGVAGMLANRDGVKMILVSDRDTARRKRFTIAHELGHHFLHLNTDQQEVIHRDVDVFRAVWDDGDFNREEWQANYFAGALLMPRSLITRFFEKEPDIDTLAVIFNVSAEAITVRLKQLGLLEQAS